MVEHICAGSGRFQARNSIYRKRREDSRCPQETILLISIRTGFGIIWQARKLKSSGLRAMANAVKPARAHLPMAQTRIGIDPVVHGYGEDSS
jgi:hypothetical protein